MGEAVGSGEGDGDVLDALGFGDADGVLVEADGLGLGLCEEGLALTDEVWFGEAVSGDGVDEADVVTVMVAVAEND